MSRYIGMNPETILWPARKTRVFTHAVQNPWSRDGSHARADRALLAGLNVDRPEEDEDYDVVAPPRATVRWVQGTPGWADGWFSDELWRELLVADLKEFGDEHLDITATPTWERPKGFVPKPPPVVPRYEVRLEDNLDELDELDAKLDRSSPTGHWLARRLGRRWVESLAPTLLLCSDGEHRMITAQRAAWVLEHGALHSTDKLKRSCGQGANRPGGLCVAPDHYKKITKRGPA